MKEKFFQELPESGAKICLGLNKGSMSSAFNYYPISQVGAGAWLGEEAYFFPEIQELSYSVRTSSQVKLLKIGLTDFRNRAP